MRAYLHVGNWRLQCHRGAVIAIPLRWHLAQVLEKRSRAASSKFAGWIEFIKGSNTTLLLAENDSQNGHTPSKCRASASRWSPSSKLNATATAPPLGLSFARDACSAGCLLACDRNDHAPQGLCTHWCGHCSISSFMLAVAFFFIPSTQLMFLVLFP